MKLKELKCAHIWPNPWKLLNFGSGKCEAKINILKIF